MRLQTSENHLPFFRIAISNKFDRTKQFFCILNFIDDQRVFLIFEEKRWICFCQNQHIFIIKSNVIEIRKNIPNNCCLTRLSGAGHQHDFRLIDRFY